MSCIAFSLFAQKDKSSCLDKSFTFFTGFEGFYLEDCGYAEFGSYSFYNANGGLMTIKEGVYRWVRYRKMSGTNRSVSGLQVIQNHANAIKAVGGEVVKESDGNIFKTTYNGKEIWIYLNSSAYNKNLDNYTLHSIEVNVMEQEISAQDIKGSIASQGKIALYGILFDTGKSDIKPESSKTIKEIATFLHENPSLQVYIVGHTDNVGQSKINMELSRSRASAVVNELTTTYKIDASRLEAAGAGPFAPISTNDTEEGKKLNRRVEIVKK